MFVTEKGQGEATEAPAKTMKLSEAIRIGAPHVKERPGFQGCAVACAAYAIRGYAHNYFDDDFWYPSDAARHFGVPIGLVKDVSRLHFAGMATREQCADWLELQGF